GHISEGIREKKNLQAALLQEFQQTGAEIRRRRPEFGSALSALSRPIQWLRTYLLVPAYGVPVAGKDPFVRAVNLAESISDLNYAIKTHEVFRVWFTRWLRVHIAISAVLYALLALHIWGAIHFGIRWFVD